MGRANDVRHFRNFLDDYSSRLESVKQSYQDGYSPSNYRRLSKLLFRLEKETNNLFRHLKHGEVERFHHLFSQHRIHSTLRESPFLDRAYSKPVEHGDFALTLDAYEDGFQGMGQFAMDLHHASVNLAVARAMRARLAVIMKFYKEVHKKRKGEIIVTGSGPCFEIPHFYFCNYASDRTVDFYLVEQDLTAISYSKNILKGYKAHFMISGLDGFLSQKTLPKADLLYSIGLFDHVPVSGEILKRFFGFIKKGGRIVISSLNMSNPSRGFMELALDWKLIHRTGEELNALAVSDTYSHRIETDETGFNHYLVIEKK